MLAHSCFNSYAPELVLLFYSAIKHGYRYFISILTRQNRVYLSILLPFFESLYWQGVVWLRGWNKWLHGPRAWTQLRGNSHILSSIKQGSFPSLCIGGHHGTVLELRNNPDCSAARLSQINCILNYFQSLYIFSQSNEMCNVKKY